MKRKQKTFNKTARWVLSNGYTVPISASPLDFLESLAMNIVLSVPKRVLYDDSKIIRIISKECSFAIDANVSKKSMKNIAKSLLYAYCIRLMRISQFALLLSRDIDSFTSVKNPMKVRAFHQRIKSNANQLLIGMADTKIISHILEKKNKKNLFQFTII